MIEIVGGCDLFDFFKIFYLMVFVVCVLLSRLRGVPGGMVREAGIFGETSNILEVEF